ncbi:MAG TPA: A24 family peptidase [Gammaproteobacteria bacterium]|nr:A24 family peptidase [Gammaproteobacteria bacterium]
MSIVLLIESSPVLFIVLSGLLGLVIGSFLNVVIYRLPLMLEREWRTQCAELNDMPPPEAERYNLIVPRSRCPHCGHAITALENIPLLSYLGLRGRCHSCHARISLRYPLIELATGALSAWVAWHFGFGWTALGALLLTWVLLSLTAIDFDQQLLPDKLTLPLLWLGLAFNLGHVFTDLSSAVIGALAGYLSLWCVFHAFKWVTGKEGMGYGDFKLFAALGAWLGWQMLPAIILLAAATGAVVGIALILSRRLRQGVPMPFGPFLAAAGWIALLWGHPLTDAYLGLAGLS